MNLAAARVLVVDDDEPIRALLKAVLSDAGYVVECAADGPEALALLNGLTPGKTFHPHLILLDLNLPQMSGAALVAEYRRRDGAHAPIVLVSASPELDAASETIRPACVVPKPFEIDDLLEQIETVLHSRRLPPIAPIPSLPLPRAVTAG